LPQHL
jgi:Leucine-rich repeat (LRR) protein